MVYAPLLDSVSGILHRLQPAEPIMISGHVGAPKAYKFDCKRSMLLGATRECRVILKTNWFLGVR
jgi:hypothetical protein